MRLLYPPDAPAGAAPPPSPPAAPPAAPPPGPAPAPPSEPDPFAEVDALFKAAETPPAPPSAPPKGEPPKGTPPAKPAAAPPTAPPKAPPTPAPKELRAELDRIKGELKTKTDSYAALEAKIADYERRGIDATALTERLATIEKQMEAKDAEIRALKHEASPEFKDKYDVPFNRLAARAQSVVEKIRAVSEDGETRNATWADFGKLYSLDEYTATREARTLFGDEGAGIAMRYYNELHRLDDDRAQALLAEREHWKERETAEQAKRVTTQQQIDQLWQRTNQDLSERVEDYRDPADDKELADARAKAYAVYDAQPKTLRERIVKDAHVRQRVAAFVPLKIRLARLAKERDDLQAELDGLKETGSPGHKPARPGGPSGAAPEEDFEAGLRKHMQGVS